MKKIRHKLYLVVILTLTLGVLAPFSVYAALHAYTASLNNEFNGGYVNAAVIEKGKNHEDSSNNIEEYDALRQQGQIVTKEVSVKNIAEGSMATAMYTRVRLLPSIVSDKDASIHLGGPVKVTYTFEENTAWKEKDGTYYYTKMLEKGEESAVLLKKVQIDQDIPEGYHLELKVAADSIVTRPADTLAKAWELPNGFVGMNTIPQIVKIN